VTIIGGANAAFGSQQFTKTRETFKGSARRAAFKQMLRKVPAPYQEMLDAILESVVFRDELINHYSGVFNIIAEDGLDGGGSTPTVTIGVADGGITKVKLSATGGTASQVLTTDGTSLSWSTPASASVTEGWGINVTGDEVEREGPYVDVTYYGATGDGLTDDTTAIEAAVAVLTSGDCLYFPSGEYVLDNEISIPDGCSMAGDGLGTVILRGATPDGYLVTLGNRCVLRDLTIDGNADTCAAGTDGELSVAGDDCIISRVRIIDSLLLSCLCEGARPLFIGCEFKGYGSTSAGAETAINCSGAGTRIVGCSFVDYLLYACYLGASGTMTGCYLANNFLRTASPSGQIRVGYASGDGWSISNNVIREGGTTSHGIDVYGVNTTICNNCIDNQGENGIVYSGYNHHLCVGNVVTNSDGSGIKVYGSSYVAIVGNDCHNNGGYGIELTTGTVTDYCTVVGNIAILNSSSGVNAGSGTHNEIAHNIV